ncbi:MAG: type II secretion system protein [Patescibacteria group bacterium]
MKRNTGFTLIELLVVIAIIGILSSIVLASLNSARAKGTDAAIKSTLAQIRTQASLYYDNNSQSFGTAGTACNTAGSVLADPTITSQINSLTGSAGVTPTCATGPLTPANAWVVSSPLKTAGNWCVDSTGVATSTTADTVNIKCN